MVTMTSMVDRDSDERDIGDDDWIMVMVVFFNMILYHSEIEGGWRYGDDDEDEDADGDEFDNTDADEDDNADDDVADNADDDEHDNADDDVADNADDDEYDNASGPGG